MYLQDYFWFLGAIAFCGIFAAFASAKINSAYKKYSKVMARSRKTGGDTAKQIMLSNNIAEHTVGRVKGNLSDHYDPRKKLVNLSEGVYDSSSVAAVAVAAHEMGHVMQKQEGYWLYKIRTAIVPAVNFGSYLALPLVFIGLLLDVYYTASGESIGFYVAMLGVILYGGSFLFTLVTLPVELNASQRAKEMLLKEGILYEDEISGAKKVLSAAAMTYLASLLTSLVYFLRFFLYVLTMFGKRNNRR